MIRNRLKILLVERDLNYSNLSKMTGISVNALSKMGKGGGTGSSQITYDVLEKLCKTVFCNRSLTLLVPELQLKINPLLVFYVPIVPAHARA